MLFGLQPRRIFTQSLYLSRVLCDGVSDFTVANSFVRGFHTDDAASKF